MIEMTKKTYATIYVDEDVIRKAKEIGLNISKTCENALKEAIRRLKGSNANINCGNSRFGSSEHVVDGAGFEPAASAMPTLRSFQADLPAQQPTWWEKLLRILLNRNSKVRTELKLNM